MIAWKPSEILEVHRAGPAGRRGSRFTSVSTDTRTIKPGALFVALTGPSFDGHDFVATAALRTARLPRWWRSSCPVDVPRSSSPIRWRRCPEFAREWRRQFPDSGGRRDRQQRQDDDEGVDRRDPVAARLRRS